jgi:hypothetical protein
VKDVCPQLISKLMFFVFIFNLYQLIILAVVINIISIFQI